MVVMLHLLSTWKSRANVALVEKLALHYEGGAVLTGTTFHMQPVATWGECTYVHLQKTGGSGFGPLHN